MAAGKLTIEDVARAAGVSRATVSRVMNDVPGATEAVRRRVRTVIAELGYVPDQAARALASRQQSAIDVVVAAPVDLAARFQRRCRRVVSLVETAPSVPAVEADNLGGTYAAVAYLHRLGRRRIAAVHGPEVIPCGVSRRAGYLRAVGEFGLEDLGIGADFTRDGGFEAARHLLERYPDLDAMFVACDLMGAGAVQAVTGSGRRIPQDVSVVGFDDSIAAICSNPQLTTMRLPVEEMAGAATRLLLDGPVEAGYRRRFPVELVVRESA